MLNRRYIFKWLGFRASHVSFRGGNSYGCYLQAGSVLLDWKGKSLMLRNPCDTYKHPGRVFKMTHVCL